MSKMLKQVANVAFLGMVPSFNEKEKSYKMPKAAPAAAAPTVEKQAAVTPGATQDEIQAAVDAERKRRIAMNNNLTEEDQGLLIGNKTILGG